MGPLHTSRNNGVSRREWSPVSLLISAAILGCFLCLSIWVNGQLSFAKAKPLSPTSINVLELENNERLRRRKVSDPRLSLDEQYTLPRNTIRQYSYLFTLSNGEAPPQRTIIPQNSGHIEAYVNGVGIGQEQFRTYAIAGQKPAYVDLTIPSSHFQTGNNRLEFIMTPNEWGGGLSDIYLGSAAELEPVAQRLSSMKFIRAIWAICASIALLIAIIGLTLNGRLQRYGVFAVASGALIFKSVLSPNAVLPMGLNPFILSLVLELILGVCICVLVIRTRKYWGTFPRGLVLVAILGLLLIAYTFIPISNGTSFDPLLLFMALSALPLFGFSLWNQLQADYAQSKVSQKEILNKLAAAEKTISDQRAALDQEIKKSAQMEERQRLTRDIHDGIGGHLLSLLVRVKSGDASSTDIESDLQDGLNDLRLIVDSMDHSSDDLESALKTFHARARPQLTASGIALDWTFSKPFEPGHYGPKTVLSLYRFMQEALSNTVRHSGADKLCIDLSCSDSTQPFRLYIADNGKGIADLDLQPSGQGLKNMQARAKSLGANLVKDVGLGGEGLSYTLTIPPVS